MHLNVLQSRFPYFTYTATKRKATAAVDGPESDEGERGAQPSKERALVRQEIPRLRALVQDHARGHLAV